MGQLAVAQCIVLGSVCEWVGVWVCGWVYHLPAISKILWWPFKGDL